MTIEEIYSSLASHMILGMMTHQHLANYYDFLGLKGYKRCHEYHYLKQTCAYRKLCRYYINHFNRLIPQSIIEPPNIIPASWFIYTRFDVDPQTKQKAVKNGLEAWVNWERQTKYLYENMYIEAMNIGQVAAALKIKGLVCDVDKELKEAERYHLNKKALNYDLYDIISDQECKHQKYKKKTQEEIGKQI